MKISQNRQILEYMQQGNPITQAEAVERFGCYRLSARIWDLRADGHIIKMVEKTAKNRYGNTCNFAEYTLVN